MTVTRRGALGAMAAGIVLSPRPTLAAAPMAGRQVAGVRRFRVGRFEVTALLDGHLDLGLELFSGIGRAEVRDLLRQGLRPADKPISTPVIGHRQVGGLLSGSGSRSEAG